jgi:hypothetical protein
LALRWVQLPVGILIYVVPPELAKPLVFCRFTFFFVALMLIGGVFGQRKFGAEPARCRAFCKSDSQPSLSYQFTANDDLAFRHLYLTIWR